MYQDINFLAMMCKYSNSKVQVQVWKGYDFEEFVPHNKADFKFPFTRWLLHVFGEGLHHDVRISLGTPVGGLKGVATS